MTTPDSAVPITLEEVTDQTIGSVPLMQRLTEYANYRNRNTSPHDALLAMGMDPLGATRGRYERWWRQFCVETGRVHRPYVGAFRQLGNDFRERDRP